MDLVSIRPDQRARASENRSRAFLIFVTPFPGLCEKEPWNIVAVSTCSLGNGA